MPACTLRGLSIISAMLPERSWSISHLFTGEVVSMWRSRRPAGRSIWWPMPSTELGQQWFEAARSPGTRGDLLLSERSRTHCPLIG